jgi:hypothetical protein
MKMVGKKTGEMFFSYYIPFCHAGNSHTVILLFLLHDLVYQFYTAGVFLCSKLVLAKFASF